jgi:hypothetical protein
MSAAMPHQVRQAWRRRTRNANNLKPLKGNAIASTLGVKSWF